MPKSKLTKFKPEEIENAIIHSSTIDEVVRKLGYKSVFNSTKKELEKFCENHGLDSSILDIRSYVEIKTCSICGMEKPFELFYHKRTVCKECVKEKERNKYNKRMEELNNYKKTLKCKKCGNDKYYLLDFHHIDPSKKDYAISDNSHAKIETILKEAAKCVLLCSNCHREFHFLNKEYGTTLDEYLEMNT